MHHWPCELLESSEAAVRDVVVKQLAVSLFCNPTADCISVIFVIILQNPSLSGEGRTMPISKIHI